jgi:hypothetical protein
MVAYDVMILRLRYQRTSFRASTDAKIEYLLSLLDEIASFYAQQSASGKGGRQENAKPVTAQNAAPPHR